MPSLSHCLRLLPAALRPLVLGLALGCLPGAALAVPVDLFEVELDAPLADEEAFAAGLQRVITRLTGSRAYSEDPSLAALLEQPSRSVMSYRRIDRRRLLIRYDQGAIESAIDQAGLPYWGGERPLTMVWVLAPTRAGTLALVGDDVGSAIREATQRVADERGLPLAWPSALWGDAGETAAEAAWAGDLEALSAFADARGADAILVGRPQGDDWSSGLYRWTYRGEFGSGGFDGDLGAGPEQFSDVLASRLASVAAGAREQVEISVTGVTTAARHARLLEMLGAMAGVDRVSLRQADPDSVVLVVSVRGGLPSLRAQLPGSGLGQVPERGSHHFILRP
ncbi:MAG: DUF2066 domain-containing protein [Steroidobacteraceae bacterium]